MINKNMQFCRPDKEVEERAQKAIDNFFSNNLIAPSPWNSNAKGKAGASNLVGMKQESILHLQFQVNV